MGVSKLNACYKQYWFLSTIRILLVFVPQMGYIHPDEYFQTIEVLAGRIFEFETSLPWEFNVTQPVRSIGVPYFTIGFSYTILRTIDLFTKIVWNITVISPYTLIIVPRLFLCLMSFLVDYSLYKICLSNSEKYRSRLLVLSGSYVMIVFGTRTFTNTLELILFALLLYYISESMIFSNIIVRQREYLNKRYNKTKNPAERAKFHKLRLFLASHSFRNCLQISTLTVLGFFNRPTFLCFAMFPIFFWLYRGIGYKSVTAMQFHSRILVLVLGAIPPVLFLIAVDSFFYGYISWGEIGMLDISINSFVFPPLNFIKYNIDSSNLANHGIHPRYLHVIVNIPLLFNVLGIIGIIGFLDLLKKLLSKKFHLLPTVRSIKGLMTVSFIAPIAFLSAFPHQEPRFLLPLIVPLVYLFGNDIHIDPDLCLMKSTKEKNKKELLEDKVPLQKSSNYTLKLYAFFNIICVIYFGFFHQGGVYQGAKYLSKEINSKPYLNYHLVTSHIYSIPHVFFLQPDTDKLFYKKNSKYQVSKHVFTYELGSKDLRTLLDQVSSILKTASNHKRRYKVYLMATGTLHTDLLNATAEYEELNINLECSLFPHISTEALPDVSELVHLIAEANVKNVEFSSLVNCIYDILSSLSVKIYEFSLKKL